MVLGEYNGGDIFKTQCGLLSSIESKLFFVFS